MLYYLFDFLDKHYNFVGAGLFQYLTFRSLIAVLIALLISWVLGGYFINTLKKLQFKETIRTLGLPGEEKKKGTPTMGGIIILSAILLPTILLCRLDNVYVWLMIIITLWLGFIGFLDDYIKVFKKDKEGLKARFKLIGQFGVGILVGAVMYFHPSVVIRKEISTTPQIQVAHEVQRHQEPFNGRTVSDYRAPLSTVPFLKNSEFDYRKIIFWADESTQMRWAWLLYIPLITLIIAFISNGVNLTDGIDGLATGVSAVVMLTLGILAYVSGNSIAAKYLNIMYLPNTGELVIFAAAFMGACIGFLWYNAYPATVFMGDTGSLAIGGIVAAFAIIIRKEFLLPVLCGVFIIENLSVMVQVSYFKYTKRKYGEGRRLLKMSPLHHHYQKLNMHESKIVTRFWIVSILLAIITLMLLKVR